MGWFGRFLHNDKGGNIPDIKELPLGSTGYSPLIRPNIWAIGGCKGGVGKSLMTSSLGILLSGLGKRVLLVDVDLGAANLHSFVGVEGNSLSLSDLLKGRCLNIKHVIGRTSIPGLELISGAKDSLDVVDLNGNKVTRLQDALKNMEYNYILLDIGPGTSSNMLDLFLMADEGILMTTPEPTAIENTYRFLKCLFLRRMKKIMDPHGDSKLKVLLQKVFSEKEAQRTRTIADIFVRLRQLDWKQEQVLKAIMGDISVSIVINQAKRSEDRDIGSVMKRACYDYFGLEIGYLGHICYEDCVVDSIRSRRPLVLHYNHSESAKAIEVCLHRLMEKRRKRYGLSLRA
ncbi:MAG: AAA family ATPase [Deltaproteobacteria bacterium]|nr:AAA family ATPase [Deltaproteobacteria bacterium]